MKARILLVSGLVCLISCPFLLVFRQETIAEKLSVLAYLFLAVGTIQELNLRLRVYLEELMRKFENLGRFLFFSLFYFLVIGVLKLFWLPFSVFNQKKKVNSYWQPYSLSKMKKEVQEDKETGDIYILGISAFYHDASAVLLKNGKVVAAAAEERFTRLKHDNAFPERAIEYCLNEAGISSHDIDYVGFYEVPILKLERIVFSFIKTFPWSYQLFLEKFAPWLTNKFFVKSIIRERLNYQGPIVFIDHHLSHAASTFFPSPFSEADIITVDGVGEWTTTALGYGQANQVYLKKRLKFPHSLGLFYSTFTAFLGFRVNNGEYKVMGLAPYGKPRYLKKLKKMIDIKEDGSFALNMDYFTYEKENRMFAKKLINFLGFRPRQSDRKLRQKDKDLARSIQEVTNEIMVKMANNLQKQSGRKYLCLAGGVALNCVANSEILKRTNYKDVFVYPDPGDGGGSVGIAYYIWQVLLKRKKRERLNNVNFGPQFSLSEIKAELERVEVAYRYFKEENKLIKVVADLIKQQKVIGWFHGRMEFGPRALGNRSILADPRNVKNKEIVNAKIKFREAFRPFAPAVLENKAHQFFEMEKKKNSPFMLFVFQAKSDDLPAVVHLDGSSRIQTIAKMANKRYYSLIKQFGELTGTFVVLNTSFNRRGEPIVCTPSDALSCFLGSGLDYLVIENFIISKEDV